MSIFDVEHQDRAQRIIQRALASKRMPHAYLFAGPEGVGKEMLAGRLAQLLLCESPIKQSLPDNGEALDACGQCQDCRLVKADTHPDLFLIYRQLNKQHPDSVIRKQKALFLSVDVIRHFLVNRISTSPSRGRAKVFIVREAERLNEAAQNSLLKTLEEPPPSTSIILLTTAMDRMLPTTRSRCQQVQFQSLPEEYIANRLHELRPDADPKEVAYIAKHVNGSLGQAVRQVDDGLFELKKTWGEHLVDLVSPKAGFAPNELAKPFEADAKKLGKAVADRDPDVSDTDATREGLQALLSVMADFYLDALRETIGTDLKLINADQPKVVDRLAKVQDANKIQSALRQISLADANISRSAHIELTLETLFIRLAEAARGSTPSRIAG